MSPLCRRATALAALAVFLSSPAFAGPADKDKASDAVGALEAPFRAAADLVNSVFDLGNILVGGKRLGSPFQEFVESNISSTSVVARQEMEASGAKNLSQALEEVPGVVISDLSGNGEEPTLDFRGFNEGRDFIFTLDGVRLNEPKSDNINFPLIPIGMLDRIEVSRGGASFLYGEGAMGGVANLVTEIPTEPGLHGRVTSRAGSFGEWGEGFEVSDRQKNVAVYTTGDTYHERGFRQNSDVDKNDLYVKALWDSSEESRLQLAYLYADAHLGRPGSIRETLLNELGPEATERPRNFGDLEANLFSEQYELKPAESLALTQNAFFRRSTELSVANFATFDTDDNELDLATDSWGGTLQADESHELFGKLGEEWLAGVEYTGNAIDEEDYNRSKSTLERLGQTVDSNAHKESAGVFTKLSLDWNKRAGVYFGLRYDDIRFRNSDAVNPDNNTPSDVSKVSHSAGASYQATEHLALTATYSHSFRAPTLSDLYANPLFGGNPALKPEESSDYETGAKWQDGAQIFKSSLFLNRRVNEIGFDPNLTDSVHLFGRNNNFGKTERYGVETSYETRPWRRFRWRAGHTYTQAFFTSNSADGTEISGDHIPMIPRNRFTTDFLFEPSSRWTFDLNLVAVSKQVLTNDITNHRNDRRLAAYQVANFKSIYRWKGWELSFEIRNLFDQQYDIGGSVGAAPSPFNTDHTVEDNFFVPAPGRSYSGQLAYSW